jgi:hypothetical protein
MPDCRAAFITQIRSGEIPAIYVESLRNQLDQILLASGQVKIS